MSLLVCIANNMTTYSTNLRVESSCVYDHIPVLYIFFHLILVPLREICEKLIRVGTVRDLYSMSTYV